MYNGYFIIDSHCHIYPEKIASLAVNHTDTFYNEKSKCKGTIADLLEDDKISHIDKFIVQSVATSKHQVRKINEFIASEVKDNPDKLIGLGTMHPESDDLEGDILHLISLNLKGIKLHPDIQNFKVDNEGYKKIYELASRYSVPILMHTGDNRYDNSNPNRLVPILKEFKNLKIIGAHFGGWSIWEDACNSYKDFDNFYVDCSSSMAYLSNESVKKIILTYGVDKVLFGSDYPMWSAKTEIERLLQLGFTKKEYEKIFSLNAKKFYNI